MGDWEDSGGKAQGDAAFAVATVTDDNSEKAVQWDVGGLVQAWIDGPADDSGGGGCGCRLAASRHAPAAAPFMLLLAVVLTAVLRRRRPGSP